MLTDIGEYIVGAYLQLVEACDFVDYNVRPPGGRLEGFGELGVVGLHIEFSTAFLCEVTTHIRGLLYKDNKETLHRFITKHERQKEYAGKQLGSFDNHIFMLWSLVVPVDYITNRLIEIDGLQVVINGEYKKRIQQLKQLAKNTTHDTINSFFRMLQYWNTCEIDLAKR